MRNGKIAAGVLAGMIGLATPAAAVAPGVTVDSGQFAVGITGFVPVVCRASVDAGMVSPGRGSTSLGSLNEFCNSSAGYRVVADYSPSLASGKLVVDGKAIVLTAAGSVVVTQSDRAAIASRPIALDAPAGTTGGSLSFRIEPR